MKKNKKNLILFMPSIEGGGVEKNLIILANYFAKNFKNIQLITYDNSFSSNFNKKIQIIFFKKKSKNESKYFKYFICLYLLIKQYIIKKNLLVFAFQANIYCLILSKFLNLDVIVRSNSSPTGWSNSYVKNFIFKFFFKYAKNIIVNSIEFKKQFDRKFNTNCKVIYNPLNKKEIIKKSLQKININFFKSKKILKIINVARFTDQKDHLTLLEGFMKISNKIKAELLIVGYGKNENLIKNFIKENKLQKKIKILKYQKNPYKFIKKADIFILSSLYEGLPNVLLEALTLKKFVISSDCPTGPKEILENGRYGFLFKVGDKNQLANLIIKYSKNKKLYNKKIILAYKSLQRFDFNNCCNKYLSLVRSAT